MDGSSIPGLSVLYEKELMERSKTGTVTYKYLKDGSFFVVSGEKRDGNNFYIKEIIKDGGYLSIETEYQKKQNAAGVMLCNSFKTFPEMNIVRLSGELTQGSSKYPVEFKFTVAEDGSVSGYYWYKKYAESNHIDISGKVSEKKPRTLTLVTGKGTEEWVFDSNSSGPLSMYSLLTGVMYKYENNDARLRGESPSKEYRFTLQQ